MTTKHHLTNADELFVGAGYHEALHATNERNGKPVDLLTKISLGSPVALDADGYAAAEDGTGCDGATAMTLGGALSGTADVPRNVVITSVGDDSGITFDVTGTDAYGVTVVETITGANAGAAAGAKAFKTVTQIMPSGASAGNVSAGTGDVLGLPYKLASVADCIRVYFNDAIDDSATVVAAVTDTATATTGDVRGTVDTNSACDGSAVVVWANLDGTTKAGLVGVDQYGG